MLGGCIEPMVSAIKSSNSAFKSARLKDEGTAFSRADAAAVNSCFKISVFFSNRHQISATHMTPIPQNTANDTSTIPHHPQIAATDRALTRNARVGGNVAAIPTPTTLRFPRLAAHDIAEPPPAHQIFFDLAKRPRS